MFIQTWNKYLPVIKILIKRSVNGVQTLDMNQSDFQRATGGRKVKFVFAITLRKGRIQNTVNPSQTAKDLLAVLQMDSVTNSIIREQEFEFTMNNNFQLLIKNITPPQTTSGSEPDAKDNSTEANDNAANESTILDDSTDEGKQ
ncbi:MAG TPA: hypothetical protein VG676_12095 [Chitinophagaceae bacterium]|jgi:hypothetical protein|nr:hypothetical protein [Chitinophagaceae bacterium]